MANNRYPNVILITTDQQRYDTLGVTGNPYVQTPHFDALANRGVLFRRGYIQNPVCIPSRACIQTGRYIHQHGVEFMADVIGTTPGLPPWEKTFMERLQDVGYSTAAFGKIHMMPPKGFDEMQLTLGKGARWTVSEGSPLGPAQLGPTYAEWLERKRPGAYEEIYAQRRLPEYRDQQTALPNVLAPEECVDYWIGENTCDYLTREHDQPFFIWCGLCGPHTPFDPPEPYASEYSLDDIPLPRLFNQARDVPDAMRRPRFGQADGEQLIRRIVAYYWSMMNFLDDIVGRITSVLTERGLWDDTLVIVTSDHGEMLGDFGQLGKGNFTESVIRAPYIIVAPANHAATGVGGGLQVDDLVEHVDLAPTILDYAGVCHPAQMPGESLRGFLERAKPGRSARESVLCEYTSNDRTQRSKCLRTERYKYVFHGTDQPGEFYDLHEDPDELTNLTADRGYADERRHHAELLLDRLTRTAYDAWNTTGAAEADDALDHFGRTL